METTDVLRDRRGESRVYCCGDRIRWKHAAGEARRGWMNDESGGGLSFLADEEIRPSVGDELELVGDARHAPANCRVLRVEPAQWKLARIACVRIEPSPITVPYRSHPWLEHPRGAPGTGSDPRLRAAA